MPQSPLQLPSPPWLSRFLRDRKGAALVLVAGGLVTLIAIASLALDVSAWYGSQSKLENMTRAAARAGYERLKELDFNYQNPSTRRSVDQTIREYLELNGASSNQARTAVIQVSKINEVKVTLSEVTGTYMSGAAGVSDIEIWGRGALSDTNNLAPFSVPMGYHDPDHDLVPNFHRQNGDIEDLVRFEVGRPYVVKYGKPVFSQYDDFILVPMDDQAYEIPAEAFMPLRVPTLESGVFTSYDRPIVLPPQHMDLEKIYQVGVFRAYGVAYSILGLGEIDQETAIVHWLLGLAGGSFLFKKKFLEAAGYQFEEDGEGYGTILDPDKNPTHVQAMRLRLSDRGHRNYVRDVGLFRYLTEVLPTLDQRFPDQWKTPAISILELSEQPQVLTITGSADPVTRVMDFSQIPYVAASDQWNPRLHEDKQSSCQSSYQIQDKYRKAFQSPKRFRRFLESAPNASYHLNKKGRLPRGKGSPPLRDRGFDWVHIHHEDFTEAGLYPHEKRAMVLGLRDFVRRGHHHLFAACLAIESLEIFLSASDYGERPTGLFPELLNFNATLAFRGFQLDDSRGGAESLPDRYASSTIDSEKSEWRQGDASRYFLTDYQNARCQNHDGFGGVSLDLNQYPPVLTDPVEDPARRMTSPEGSTNSMLRDVLKPHGVPNHDGLGIPNRRKPLLVLGAIGDPTQGIGTWAGKHVRYLTGVADNDNDLSNGHGEFTYLGGHRPKVPAKIQKGDPVEYTWVGDFHEGHYYDDNDTYLPEVLHTGKGEELRFDFDGDGKSESKVEIVRLQRDGHFPKSLTPKPTREWGWPTHPGAIDRSLLEDPEPEPEPSVASTPSTSASLLSTASTPSTSSTTEAVGDLPEDVEIEAPTSLEASPETTAEAPSSVSTAATLPETDPNDSWDGTKAPTIAWNDRRSRWYQNHQEENFTSLVESSAVRIQDIDNDGKTGEVFPGDLYEVGKPDIAAYRLFLNNILYGAVSIAGEKKNRLNLGTINPQGLDLGEGPGGFGEMGTTGRNGSMKSIFQFGVPSKQGMPLDTVLNTAPGIYSAQIEEALEFNFRDRGGNIDSIPWSKSEQGEKAGPTQIKIVPVVERTDDPDKSFYFGYSQHSVRVIGYARFFLIDTTIDKATLTTNPEDPDFLGGPPLEGEVRGYFLGWVIPPEGEEKLPSREPPPLPQGLDLVALSEAATQATTKSTAPEPVATEPKTEDEDDFNIESMLDEEAPSELVPMSTGKGSFNPDLIRDPNAPDE